MKKMGRLREVKEIEWLSLGEVNKKKKEGKKKRNMIMKLHTAKQQTSHCMTSSVLQC